MKESYAAASSNTLKILLNIATCIKICLLCVVAGATNTSGKRQEEYQERSHWETVRHQRF